MFQSWRNSLSRQSPRTASGPAALVWLGLGLLLGPLAALPLLAAGAAEATADTSARAETDREIGEILQPIPLTERVYYFYGSIEGRAPHNLGMNNNTGFVLTDTGVVVIDSGPGYQASAMIAEAIASISDLPITHVINLGSQDHRWLGNGWFLEQGAEIIALERTVQTQQNYARSHLNRSNRVVGEPLMAGTVPTVAPSPIAADRVELTIGGVRFELAYIADAHFPGDILVHLPDEGVVFAGDSVYTERIVGIHAWSDPEGKLANIRQIEAWNPRIVVPGHGSATDLATVQRDARDYLQVVVTEVRAALEEWATLDDTVARLADLPDFAHLLHYAEWHRVNVNQIYLILEVRQ